MLVIVQAPLPSAERVASVAEVRAGCITLVQDKADTTRVCGTVVGVWDLKIVAWEGIPAPWATGYDNFFP